MDENALYQKLCEVTGPRPNIPIHDHRLYGSYHFEKFNKVDAWRNTLTRFKEFLIPYDLSGNTVFDFGSCIGSISLECARRKASTVIGFEYTKERVEVANQLAEYLNVSNKVKFLQMDINQQDIIDFLHTYGTADIVFCCSLDLYVEKDHLYKLVSLASKNTCYFETNSGSSDEEFIKTMTNYGFKLIINLGMSQSDPNPNRRSYFMQKTPDILRQKKGVSLKMGEQFIPIDNTLYRINNYVAYQYIDEIYYHIKDVYDHVSDIKYVGHMVFHYPYIIMPFYSHQLTSYAPTDDDKATIKGQLIDFIKQLNEHAIAHRDLHTSNMYWDNGLLRICDWEVACDNHCDIKDCYDLTGQSIEGYQYKRGTDDDIITDNCHIFMENSSVRNYLNNDLCLEDFL